MRLGRMAQLLLSTAGILLAATTALGAQDFLRLNARVTDQVGILSADQVERFERTLEGFERSHGSQIAVLIVASTDPMSIEQYALGVAENSFGKSLGREDIDDGILLLVARDDRRMRIEVGHGLEGAIPDAIAKRILDDFMAPRFRSGDFAGGIEEGLTRIMGLIRGEQLPAPTWRDTSSGRGRSPFVWMVILLAVVPAVIRLVFRSLGFWPTSLLGSLGGGGLIYWLSTSILLAGFGAVLAFVILIILYFATKGGGGGFFTGPGFGGSFGGGSFSSGSFGGFSGGGGSFGGGGASGSW